MDPRGRDKLFRDINVLLQEISQNLATAESLIKLTPSLQDGDEVSLKMRETAGLLKKLLPLVQGLLVLSEPIGASEQTVNFWWMERERINREFENMLKNFHRTHALWNEADMPALPTDALEHLVAYEQELSDKIQDIRRRSSAAAQAPEDKAPPPAVAKPIWKQPSRRHTTDSTAVHTVAVSRSRTPEKKNRKDCVVS